jgi:hypothetical protein
MSKNDTLYFDKATALKLYIWILLNLSFPYVDKVRDITLCDKVCQWLAAGLWFSPGTPVSFTNITDLHDINEILLKVALKKQHHNPSPTPGENIGHYMYANLSYKNVFAVLI